MALLLQVLPPLAEIDLGGAAFSQNINGSFNYKGNNRTYIIHIPPTYTGNTDVPLVLNLHGYGSTAVQQQFYSMFDDVADTANFIVVYADAVNSVWDTVWLNSPIDDVGFLSALIDTVSKNYEIDSLRIYSTGLSMGGFMTYRLGSELSEKIAAIASVAGPVIQPILDTFSITPPIPVLHIHGTSDSTVLYNGVDFWPPVDTLINFLVDKNNCPQADSAFLPDVNTADSSTVIKYHYGYCDDSTEVVFYKILNGGHTWPSGFINIPNLGNTNRDFSASGEIWNFFSRHKRNPNATAAENIVYENVVIIFPNPSSGKFEIRNLKLENGKIEIYNVLGEIIYQKTSPFNSLSSRGEGQGEVIDISAQPKGIYFVKVYFEEKTYSNKIIIE